jgi:hypothetical protein
MSRCLLRPKRSYLLSCLAEVFLKSGDAIVFALAIVILHFFAIFAGLPGHRALLVEVEGHVCAEDA